MTASTSTAANIALAVEKSLVDIAPTQPGLIHGLKKNHVEGASSNQATKADELTHVHSILFIVEGTDNTLCLLINPIVLSTTRQRTFGRDQRGA
jgi:hypothetical protein